METLMEKAKRIIGEIHEIVKETDCIVSGIRDRTNATLDILKEKN